MSFPINQNQLSSESYYKNLEALLNYTEGEHIKKIGDSLQSFRPVSFSRVTTGTGYAPSTPFSETVKVINNTASIALSELKQELSKVSLLKTGNNPGFERAYDLLKEKYYKDSALGEKLMLIWNAYCEKKGRTDPGVQDMDGSARKFNDQLNTIADDLKGFQKVENCGSNNELLNSINSDLFDVQKTFGVLTTNRLLLQEKIRKTQSEIEQIRRNQKGVAQEVKGENSLISSFEVVEDPNLKEREAELQRLQSALMTPENGSLVIDKKTIGLLNEKLSGLSKSLGAIESTIDLSPEEIKSTFKALCALQKNLDSVEALAFKEHLIESYSRAWEKCQGLKEAYKGRLPRRQNDLSFPKLERGKGGGIRVTTIAPPLKNMVLRGGGAKGLGYGPALAELNRFHMLDNLGTVVGSSAGALTAMLIATGNLEDLQKIADKVKMSELGYSTKLNKYKDNVNLDYDNSWGVRWQTATAARGYDALALLDELSTNSIRQYLKDQYAPDRNPPFPFLKDFPDFEARAMELKDQDLNASKRDMKAMVTFNDLRILSKIDPKKFKEAAMTVFDITKTQESFFIDADTYPNMPVALAARASMAIPPAFAPLKVDLDQYAANPAKKEDIRWLADGGIGNNLPSNYLLDKAKTPADKARVQVTSLLMTFYDKGKAYKKLYGPAEKEQEKSWTDLAKNWWAGKDLKKVGRADTTRAYEGGINTFVVFHGNVGTLDLGILPGSPEPGERQKKIAAFFSKKKAIEEIEKKKAQQLQMEFKSIDEAAEHYYITEEEMNAYLAWYAKNGSLTETVNKNPLYVFMSEVNINSRKIDKEKGQKRADLLPCVFPEFLDPSAMADEDVCD